MPKWVFPSVNLSLILTAKLFGQINENFQQKSKNISKIYFVDLKSKSALLSNQSHTFLEVFLP